MKTSLKCGALLAAGLSMSPAWAQTPVGTAFTYQGRLADAGSPANGVYDLQFVLFDASAAGSPVGPTLVRDDVVVTDGLFTVTLDFGGAAFAGSARWLEIGVRPGSSGGAFITLAVRQELTPAPNAVFGQTAPWTGVGGKPAGFADDTDDDVLGALSCNAGEVPKWSGTSWGCAADWSLNGNLGTGPGDFLGTRDNQALELRVNNARALRIEPHPSSPNLAGGVLDNFVSSGAFGATIGGGGAAALPNRVTDNYGTVAGGRNNQAGDNAGTTGDMQFAAVAGGFNNTASGNSSAIGGGSANLASGAFATVPGGSSNVAAGASSFAAGHLASANHGGSFVWGDSTNVATSSTGNDQFLARASGGVTYFMPTAAWRLEPNATSPRVIGGFSGNSATAGVAGAVIGGGGGNLQTNRVTDDFGSVGGGVNNQAGDGAGTTLDRPYATVAGGAGNVASGAIATVAGGVGNIASGGGSTVGGGGFNGGNLASADNSTVAGGGSNEASGLSSIVAGGFDNTASATDSFVGGGYLNVAGAYRSTVAGGGNNLVTDDFGTVGGGGGNQAGDNAGTTADAANATVGGGSGNGARGSGATVAGGIGNAATGTEATVGGGLSNNAGGGDATVPGGSFNTAGGQASFAAGSRAVAGHSGTFVWGDSTPAFVASTGNDQFIVRASGGLWFGSTSAPSFPAGRFINTSTGAHLTTAGVWTNNSDRDLKENLERVDGRALLEKVARLPISIWNYKVEPEARHIGPMAQDFQAVFGLGGDEKTITTLDPAGIALAAIQELDQRTRELEAMRRQLADLEARLERLEAKTTP